MAANRYDLLTEEAACDDDFDIISHDGIVNTDNVNTILNGINCQNASNTYLGTYGSKKYMFVNSTEELSNENLIDSVKEFKIIADQYQFADEQDTIPKLYNIRDDIENEFPLYNLHSILKACIPNITPYVERLSTMIKAMDTLLENMLSSDANAPNVGSLIRICSAEECEFEKRFDCKCNILLPAYMYDSNSFVSGTTGFHKFACMRDWISKLDGENSTTESLCVLCYMYKLMYRNVYELGESIQVGDTTKLLLMNPCMQLFTTRDTHDTFVNCNSIVFADDGNLHAGINITFNEFIDGLSVTTDDMSHPTVSFKLPDKMISVNAYMILDTARYDLVDTDKQSSPIEREEENEGEMRDSLEPNEMLSNDIVCDIMTTTTTESDKAFVIKTEEGYEDSGNVDMTERKGSGNISMEISSP